MCRRWWLSRRGAEARGEEVDITEKVAKSGTETGPPLLQVRGSPGNFNSSRVVRFDFLKKD